jgi:hypothetical protein
LEEDILRCWETAAKGAKFIFNVGANAGIYSLAALAIQRDATVHAFEPTPEIAACLRATAAGYRFSRPGKRLNWQKAGDWLRTLSDVVAYRGGP